MRVGVCTCLPEDSTIIYIPSLGCARKHVRLLYRSFDSSALSHFSACPKPMDYRMNRN